MTLEHAREILGNKAKNWSDERVQQHVDRLTTIADIAAKEALTRFSLQSSTDSVYSEDESQVHNQKPPTVPVNTRKVVNVTQTAGGL